MPGPWKSWKTTVFQWFPMRYDPVWSGMALLLYSIDLPDFIKYFDIFYVNVFFGGSFIASSERGWLLSFRADLDMSRPQTWRDGIHKVEIRRWTSWNSWLKFVVKIVESTEPTIGLLSRRTRNVWWIAGAQHFDCLALSCETCKRPDLRLLLLRGFAYYLYSYGVFRFTEVFW